jgi:dipeptidyl aminopeptidase/acylaminoacyl peptidase
VEFGVIGHSHGELMVANLLAHTDLFRAGIARSRSYNKTNQPFGFQSERQSLFKARDVYIQLSPTFQSEVFFEAVRGSGGTARMVLLRFEDQSYRARESVEHVIWEQLRWFDMHVKNGKGTKSSGEAAD